MLQYKCHHKTMYIMYHHAPIDMCRTFHLFTTYKSFLVARTEYEEDTHPGKVFPRVTFMIYLRRKPLYYFLNIVTPCCFCIFIALLVFWLPPESGEKVSLGITVLLAFSVFQLVVADNTPKTSDFTPLLSKCPNKLE